MLLPIHLNKNSKKKMFIFSFLAIPVILLIAFYYYPAIKLVQMSFTNWDGFSNKMNFIGLENYKEIVTNKENYRIFLNNSIYVVAMIIQLSIGVILASILNSHLVKKKPFFRSLIFMPYILNGVAIAFMFNYLYSYEGSPINDILIGFNIEPIRFLTYSYKTNFSLAFVVTWRTVGYYMVVVLGALQSISPDLYEASKIDGASAFQNFRYITIPNIKQMLHLLFFLGFSEALQIWFEPFVITKGGPGGLTHTFVTRTMQLAFEKSNFGKASAMSVTLLILILSVLIIRTITRRKEEI